LSHKRLTHAKRFILREKTIVLDRIPPYYLWVGIHILLQGILMNLERLNQSFTLASISKKEFAKLLNINAQSVYAWESTQSAPYWIYSWLENYAKARMFDKMMELGKSLEEQKVAL
jgi:DNA-binding XRE family transcriptional regulator